jgi:hypothetical protein
MNESRKPPPLPRVHFLRRLALHVAAGLVFVPVLHRLLHGFRWDEGQ